MADDELPDGVDPEDVTTSPFKCPSSALLLPNVAPQHPGTGHMRRCSALTCQASALLEVKLAAEHEVQVQVKACSAR